MERAQETDGSCGTITDQFHPSYRTSCKYTTKDRYCLFFHPPGLLVSILRMCKDVFLYQLRGKPSCPSCSNDSLWRPRLMHGNTKLSCLIIFTTFRPYSIWVAIFYLVMMFIADPSSEVCWFDRKYSGFIGILPDRLSDYSVWSAWVPFHLYGWWLAHLSRINSGGSATAGIRAKHTHQRIWQTLKML